MNDHADKAEYAATMELLRSAANDRGSADALMSHFASLNTERFFGSCTGVMRDVVMKAVTDNYRTVTDLVFDHCGSPIERTFFFMVTMVASGQLGPLGFVLLAPTTLDTIRARQRELRWWDGALTELRTHSDHDALAREMMRSDEEEVRALGLRYFRDVVLQGEHGIHVVLQPRVTHLSIRPDAIAFDQKSKVLWAVECDGFDYHSDRAKFTSDRARDRALLRDGIASLRFSGSEIHKDPLAIAIEFVSTIVKSREKSEI